MVKRLGTEVIDQINLHSKKMEMIGTGRFKPRKLMNEDLVDKADKIGFEFIDIQEHLLADVRCYQKQKIWIRSHLNRLHLNVCLPGRF